MLVANLGWLEPFSNIYKYYLFWKMVEYCVFYIYLLEHLAPQPGQGIMILDIFWAKKPRAEGQAA